MGETSLDISSMIFAVPARVLRPQSARQAELLTLAKEQHAFDPAILGERTPFFWGAEISSDVIDSYFTRMLLNTLGNFRDDARLGVAFLPGHRHYDLPFGRSLDAILEEVANPPRTRVAADFYTLPGLRLNQVSTDDLIDGIRSGIVRDVSVGFYGGRFLCDICGRDFFDWDCTHIPGRKYEVDDNGVMRVKLATFGVDNARLAEVSAVYEGATPRAEILKAEREAEVGRIDEAARRFIEQQYRVKLPAAKRSVAGVEIPPAHAPRKDKAMELEEALRAMLTRANVTMGDDPLSGVEHLIQRVADLEPQAAEGRQYRTDLVAQALAEGVRAYGQSFDKAGWEQDMQRFSLERIKKCRDMWAETAAARLPAGRHTVDEDERQQEPETKTKTVSTVPDHAHAA